MIPELLEQLTDLAHTVSFRVPGRVRTGARARSKPGGGRPYQTTDDQLSRLDVVRAYQRACQLDDGPEQPWSTGPIFVSTIALHRKPKDWWPGRACYAKPDGDNLLKLVWDALNQVAWDDDRRIVLGPPGKAFSDVPGLAVTIRFYREVPKPKKAPAAPGIKPGGNLF